MVREKFNQIYDRAAERKGGTQALEKLLVVPKSQQELALITDDRWLATFTLRIFQSGMTWQVVRNKWPNFEDVFFGFNIEKMLLVPDEMWERKATDPAIIRHLGKVMTIPANADMIHRAAVEYGSFAQMVADWPCEDIIGLWQYLYLRNIGVIEGGKSSLKSLKATQKAFNDWQQESGRPMCQVSQIISFSCGDNHVF